jgi:hypothetical protein
VVPIIIKRIKQKKYNNLNLNKKKMRYVTLH